MRALLLLPLVLLPQAALAVEWTLFSGTTGNFQVLLPGEPTVVSDRHTTYLGDVHGVRLVHESADHRVTVTHQDIPSIATTLMPDRIILEQAGDSVVESNEGEVHREREYMWRGYAAREVSYTEAGEEPRESRLRLMLVESRIYMVIASWPEGDIPGELARFLDSFALTEPSDTPPVGAARD